MDAGACLIWGNHMKLEAKDMANSFRTLYGPDWQKKALASYREIPANKPPPPPIPFDPGAPIISSPEPTFSNHDRSLQGCSGMGQKTYAFYKIGGCADHHMTDFGFTPPPSRSMSVASFRSVANSQKSIGALSKRTASVAGRSSLSRRSNGSRPLSVVSSALLRSEIQEAVQKEVSRVATPLVLNQSLNN
eukprot:TRINITY_DN10152_c5_g1_i1.p1 TRINITY_DN10152_c5_g1~~TRINITY_DN10152_c5_g1_i1.p1  ORF type:complete len:190 (-),score=18.52 TRINITY_DN10152_c5_g1_i1:83-652(-)